MVTKTRASIDLILGLIVLVVALAALLVVALGLPWEEMPQQASLPPQTSAPTTLPTETHAPTTEPTLPPPEPNPYGTTDFQYDGRYLKCLEGESVLGIDVSEHQETVDWEAVKEAGIEFVMLRIAYRGYESGLIVPDEMVQSHYEGAIAAGLKVGGYFFSQAVSVEEAIEEARFTLDMVAGWQIEMPLVYDWEYISDEARTASVDARTLTDCSRAFCDTILEAGYDTLLYFNWRQGDNLLYLAELKDLDFWLAMYSDRMDYPYKLKMWQYTDSGMVPGIEDGVDMNLWFPE